MDKYLKFAQFIAFVVLAILPFRLLSNFLHHINYYYYYKPTLSIFHWLGGTILFLFLGSVVFGGMTILVKYVNPFKMHSITSYVIVPLSILLTIQQTVNIYAKITSNQFEILFVPTGCLLFASVYMGFKLCSVLVKKDLD